MLLSGADKVRWSSVKQKIKKEEHILSPLAPDVFLLKQNDRTLNQFMSMSIQMGFFFAAQSQKCTEHLFYIERL